MTQVPSIPNVRPPIPIQTLTSVVGATQEDWNHTTMVLAKGAVTLEVDTGIFKMGDGENLYINLPVLITIADILAAKDKAPLHHTHTASEITDLVEYLTGQGGQFITVNMAAVLRKGIAHKLYDVADVHLSSTWRPDFSNGEYQKYTLGSSAVTLQNPLVPTYSVTAGQTTTVVPADAYTLKINVESANNGGTILTAPTMTLKTGSEPLILVKGSSYLLTVAQMGSKYLIHNEKIS